MIYPSMKRKVFISFYGGDEEEVLSFTEWAHNAGVLIPKILHEAYSGAWVNSTNPDYVMNQVRSEFIGDSTVTMVLVGSCTHSRRYVDWELKSSLRQGTSYIPNGVLGVALPSVSGKEVWLPPRLEDNMSRSGPAYAEFYRTPKSAQELWDWIQDAHAARTQRAHLIKNSADMMANNARCKVCGLTHPAS